MPLRVAVIGGGISGLAAAFFLQKESRARGLDISVEGLEAEPRLGGMIQTRFQHGCLVESGPDAFAVERPALLELCRDLGLEKELISVQPQSRGLFLREGDRLYSLPEDFCGLTSMKLSTLLRLPGFSWKGKLRMACEGLVPRRRKGLPESLGGFIERRFGTEALRRLAQPFLGSIFGLDLRQVGLQASFPHWQSLEAAHGSLTKAFWAAKGKPSAIVSAGFRSFRKGLSVLVEKLAQEAGISWSTGVHVTDLKKSDGGWRIFCRDGKVREADAVFLCLGARQASRLIAPDFPELAGCLKLQPVRFVFLANAIFRRSDWPGHLRGSGIVSGMDPAYEMQGATFSSYKFEGRSPEDKVMVRIFGSALKSKLFASLPLEQVCGRITHDFCEVVGIKSAPLWSEGVRYEETLPSYDMEYPAWKQKAEDLQRGCGDIYFAGQSYQPGGLSGCVSGARKAVENFFSRSGAAGPAECQKMDLAGVCRE